MDEPAASRMRAGGPGSAGESGASSDPGPAADLGSAFVPRPPADLGSATEQVVAAMATLRSRCPWSSRQDHRSLEKYAREETDELIDALEDYATDPSSSHRAHVVEELGDVFYQVLFHSALLDESEGHRYGHSLSAIISGLEAKLIRRHPLVFGAEATDDMAALEDVEREYRKVKAEERAARHGEGESR